MKEHLKITCARSVLNTVVTASDKLRSALEKTQCAEEIVLLTTAVSDLVRALYIQDAVMPVLSDISHAPCEDGIADDMP
ncbi:MAG: hypothetical protein PUF80_00600 [Firmicutes bacterium]|nr:hypothetical protein [Bacillota bacterium]